MEGNEDLGFPDFEKMDLQNKNLQLNQALAASSYSDPDSQNLIHEQLETDKILERIEHFLKGDVIRFGEQGMYYDEPTKKVLARVVETTGGIKYYIEELKELKKGTEKLEQVVIQIKNKDQGIVCVNERDSSRILESLKNLNLKEIGYEYVEIIDESKKPLNEYGVSEMMRIISMYVTKETFLSYYDEERINEIMSDLGNALNNFLYSNYDAMGMDTKFKESKYILILLNVLHVIESCYRRALNGNEQDNLKTRAIVTQNQGAGMAGQKLIKKRWNPLKPGTW